MVDACDRPSLPSGVEPFRKLPMTIQNVPQKGRALSSAWLVTPALALKHPDEVLTHPDLTDPERKEILASWASDARAVESMPWLRRLDNGTIVPVSDILAALQALDRGMVRKSNGPVAQARGGRMFASLRRPQVARVSTGGAA